VQTHGETASVGGRTGRPIEVDTPPGLASLMHAPGIKRRTGRKRFALSAPPAQVEETAKRLRLGRLT